MLLKDSESRDLVRRIENGCQEDRGIGDRLFIPPGLTVLKYRDSEDIK